MPDKNFQLSRRKVLAGLGGIGAASAGAGLGTSAFLTDTESLENNTIAAGELDLKVDWEEHYYDGSNGGEYVAYSEPADGAVGFPDPDDPQVWLSESDIPDFMNATAIEAFPDPNNDGSQEVEFDGSTYAPCEDGADVDEDLTPGDGPATRTDNDDTYVDGEAQPLINLNDVKPGDFGELTLSFHLCDNPGYVWLQAADVAESGGENPEPEVVAEGDEENDANLAEHIQTVWWYDSRGDNVLQTDCEEKLYLADSGTGPTTLFEVTLNTVTGEAELTELLSVSEYGDSDFDQTDAIVTTPNGDEILFYDKNSGHLGTYDIGADSFTNEGAISGDPGGVVLAGYSPTGTLWAASQDTDELYTVDLSGSISATSQGDTGIDLSGADLVFSSDGTMYIWTANTDDDGLYRVDDPTNDTTAVPVDESNIGEKEERITGLAIRDGGNGDIVASDRDNDEIHIVDRTDGSITESYAMTFDGEEYEYDFGDMTAGTYCGEVFRRGTLADDLSVLESGDGIPLDGNRASAFDELAGEPFADSRECFIQGVSHYIGFAWWLPADIGNKIQGDSVSFDLGFYVEQCRHNDGTEAGV